MDTTSQLFYLTLCYFNGNLEDTAVVLLKCTHTFPHPVYSKFHVYRKYNDCTQIDLSFRWKYIHFGVSILKKMVFRKCRCPKSAVAS